MNLHKFFISPIIPAKLAEGEGFEPPLQAFALTVFKTAAIDHSATPPFRRLAGREGLEPPTDGFGDRYSTN
jgi:hypothetical protein